jgi:hypothetical protein
MSIDGPGLTVSSLRAAAVEVLTGAGYREVSDPPASSREHGGVYEDPYSIVGIGIFETWSALAAGWLDLQAALAELISENFARSDPKAWEGYLVLLTPSFVPTASAQEANEIRRDTQHVRKLLGAGDEIASLGQVQRLLLPLLPLDLPDAHARSSDALSALPPILGAQGIDPGAVQVAVDENDGLIRYRCDGLIRYHPVRLAADDLALIERGSEVAGKWGHEWSCSSRSGGTRTVRTCPSGRWQRGIGSGAGRCGRRWPRRSPRSESGRRAVRLRSWASSAS